MNKTQWGILGAAVLLFFLLYFGCDTQPPERQRINAERLLAMESTGINTLLLEAKAELSSSVASDILALEQRIDIAPNDSAKLELTEQLAGAWYRAEHPAISGYYAQQIAEQRETAEAWSIAGTTFTICTQRASEEKIRSFCGGRAVQAYESAISLEPDNVSHRVNLALVYTSNPPSDNPMKGVLQLRELNNQYPTNTTVLIALGRLAIQTGQYARAIERLGEAVRLQPDNQAARCLLADAYQGNRQPELAATYGAGCSTRN